MSSNIQEHGIENENLYNFCQKIPKIELHAHLNGSLSYETLAKLSEMHNKPEKLDVGNFETLSDAFKVFSLAHSLTTSQESVFLATYETIKEFANDNVIYLELRSTPRSEKEMTKKEYILSILRAIKSVQSDDLDIIVKLLISVNRKQGLREAKENVHLAIEMSKEYHEIVGIDLSGDPTKGNAFIELLQKARDAGLKIAAHCAEVSNEDEAKDILKFKPERLGHCTCIHPETKGSDNLFQMLLQSKIPVEICLTSNIKCKTILNYESHHLQYLLSSNHPICICTDDKGVFKTTLSKELELACRYYHLSKENIIKIMKETANYIFGNEDNKNQILNTLEHFHNNK